MTTLSVATLPFTVLAPQDVQKPQEKQVVALIIKSTIVGCSTYNKDPGPSNTINNADLKQCTVGATTVPFESTSFDKNNPRTEALIAKNGIITGCAILSAADDLATFAPCPSPLFATPSSSISATSTYSAGNGDFQTTSTGTPPNPTTAADTTIPNAYNGTIASPTTNATSPITPVKSKASGGAIAGAAVGCLIAGALLAFLACFFLFRRKNRKQQPAAFPSHLPYDGNDKSGATVVAAPVPVAGSGNVDSLLPQPVEDDAITQGFSKIRDSIKNHVQNYYHLQPVQANISTSRLEGLATATNLSTSVLAGLLSSPATRSDAIRLFIAWAVLSKTEGGGHQSLLPAELAPLLQAIPGKDGSDTAKSALFSKWKVLTAALLEQNHGGKAHASGAQVQNRAHIIELIDAVLSPFLKAGVDLGKRRDNLDMILARAAKLGFLLFSQPGSFHIDFVGGRTDALVIFPALLQVVGDHAEALSRPRVLWEKEYAATETSGSGGYVV